MFVISNLLWAVAQVLNIVLYLYMWVIIIRALVSWVSPDPYNPIVQFLYRVTEPVLAPIRQRIPFLGGIDISPLVALLLILFLQAFLVESLRGVAASLR
ncbi:MAG: YggT family protein [Nitrospinota bacterium]